MVEYLCHRKSLFLGIDGDCCSDREKPAPKKTIKVYKSTRQGNGIATDNDVVMAVDPVSRVLGTPRSTAQLFFGYICRYGAWVAVWWLKCL